VYDDESLCKIRGKGRIATALSNKSLQPPFFINYTAPHPPPAPHYTWSLCVPLLQRLWPSLLPSAKCGSSSAGEMESSSLNTKTSCLARAVLKSPSPYVVFLFTNPTGSFLVPTSNLCRRGCRERSEAGRVGVVGHDEVAAARMARHGLEVARQGFQGGIAGLAIRCHLGDGGVAVLNLVHQHDLVALLFVCSWRQGSFTSAQQQPILIRVGQKLLA